jgi:HTH-type transcriptional regulator / antitoxin HipB
MIIHSPRELALAIRDRRKELKINQAEAGKLVGLKQQTLSNFENRPDGTKIETLFRILSALNLDLKIVPKEEARKKTGWLKEW